MAERARKIKSVYFLRGNPDYPAHRVGSPKQDECGQTPWLFIDGPWKGQTVFVEPFKMWLAERGGE